MPQYSFTTWDGNTVVHSEELPDDKAAWEKAVEIVHQGQSMLSPKGSEWSLVVARGDKPIYRIDMRSRKLG
jgi:hypothetical protein